MLNCEAKVTLQENPAKSARHRGGRSGATGIRSGHGGDSRIVAGPAQRLSLDEFAEDSPVLPASIDTAAAIAHVGSSRNETVVPQQSLAMINSSLVLEQSRKLTALEKIGGDGLDAFGKSLNG